MKYQEIKQQVQTVKDAINVNSYHDFPIDFMMQLNLWQNIKNNPNISQDVLQQFVDASMKLKTYNISQIAKYIYQHQEQEVVPNKINLTEYQLIIPTYFAVQGYEGCNWSTFNTFSEFNASTQHIKDHVDISIALINHRMNHYTKMRMQRVQVKNNFYPDFLANFLPNDKTKQLVKAINFSKAIVEKDQYEMVFKVISIDKLKNEQQNKLKTDVKQVLKNDFLTNGLALNIHTIGDKEEYMVKLFLKDKGLQLKQGD